MTTKIRRENVKELAKYLELFEAFHKWFIKQPNYRITWQCCPRGEWLLNLCEELGADSKLMVRAACDCARIALPHVPKGEDRPRIAIETAESLCDGRATIEQVRAAADAADAAADATYAAYAPCITARAATYAARAATCAARADDAISTTYYAAEAIVYAAEAAEAIVYAAEAVDADSYDKAQAELADIVRARIPWSVVRDAIAKKRKELGL